MWLASRRVLYWYTVTKRYTQEINVQQIHSDNQKRQDYHPGNLDEDF